MNPFTGFHVTVRGASHIRHNTDCQDYSKSACFGNAAAAAVADGHGDVRYFRSGTGARFAVEAALKSVREFVKRENSETLKNADEKFDQLKKNIILNWNRKVARHYSSHPFSPEELKPLSERRRSFLEGGKLIESAYGTTLIVSAVGPDYWFGMQLGDGDCFAFNRDGTVSSVPREDSLVGNVTTSLCESDAFYHFHHIYCAGSPAAIIMSTDGVKNSFSSFSCYRDFMEKIVSEFSSSSCQTTKKNLMEFLSEMTEKGSGDDLSVAGVLSSAY